MIKQLPSAHPTVASGNQSSNEAVSSSHAQKEGDSTAETSHIQSTTATAAADPQQEQEPTVLGRCPPEVTFFRFLHSELRKSIRFFDRILTEYSIRTERLVQANDIFQRPGAPLVKDPWSFLARSAFKVYKDLVLLECYSIMTYCAFSKILKKHDKVTGRSTRNAFMAAMVDGANFSDSTRLSRMIQDCEARYNLAASNLENKAGRRDLQEDERLFINMVAQINSDVQLAAGAEGAPTAASRIGRGLEMGSTPPSSSWEDKKPSPRPDVHNDTEKKKASFSS